MLLNEYKMRIHSLKSMKLVLMNLPLSMQGLPIVTPTVSPTSSISTRLCQVESYEKLDILTPVWRARTFPAI